MTNKGNSTMTKKLLTPIKVGAFTLQNRIVMAPLTRCRASQPGNAPTDLNVEYYAQRADAGLIVTEAAPISPQGRGYACTPGMYSNEQEAGWAKVVSAIHAKGGKASAQLWHVGRISHTLLQEDGAAPVAPSAIPAANSQCAILQADGTLSYVPCSTPRALELTELPGIVAQHQQSAERAKHAGFDYIEVHSANGYLLNQFLATGSNQRTDRYGGSIENRARLTLEVVDAVITVMGADRTGVRLSPHFTYNDLYDAETESMTLYLARELSARNIAYLHIAEPIWVGGPKLNDVFRKALRSSFSGTLIYCGGYDVQSGEKMLVDGSADAIALGRPFIANPDLVKRIQLDAAWNEMDKSTIYGGGARGYTDYPALEGR